MVVAIGGTFFWWAGDSHVGKVAPSGKVNASPRAPEGKGDPASVKSKRAGTSSETIAALEKRIRSLLASEDPADHELVFSSLFPKLISTHPDEAARIAESMGEGPSRQRLLRIVAQEWAKRDPKAAENWAAKLADANERNEYLSAVCFQVAQGNPRDAMVMAQQHGLSNGPGAVMENLVQQWGAKDFTGAVSWVRELPVGTARDEMLFRLAFVQSQSSPAEAAAMVAKEISPGPQQDEATISIVHQWGQRDLAAASAWVELFPPGDFRERAESELAGIKANQTPKN